MFGRSTANVLPLIPNVLLDTFHQKMNWEIGLTSGMSHHENVAAQRILDQAWNNHGFGEHAVNFVQTQMCTKVGGNWHCVMIVSIPVVLQRDMSNFVKEICDFCA